MVEREPGVADARTLYAEYALANQFAVAAPAVVHRVGDALRA